MFPRTAWCADFEFIQSPGEPVERVVRLVARELISGREVRLFEEELKRLRHPPYDIGRDDLFVAYFTSAEMPAI